MGRSFSSGRAPFRTQSEFRTGGIVDLGDVLGQLVALEERRNRHASLVSLSISSPCRYRNWMATAGKLAPIVVGFSRMHYVGPVAEGAHKADREPVAGGFAKSGLIFNIVGEMGEGVALRFAAFVGDGFVASGEAYGLEAEEAIFLGLSRAN